MFVRLPQIMSLSNVVSSSPDASGLLRAVTQFSHLAADTIVNGAATSHSAPTDQADGKSHTLTSAAALDSRCMMHKQFYLSAAGLTDSCRDCANHCLQFLKDLKFQASLQRADPSAIRYTVQRLLAMAQVGKKCNKSNRN